MFALHEKYIIDEGGKKTAVVLPVKEWQKIQEILEEYNDILAYEEAKSKHSDAIPLNEAIKELRSSHK
jgi:PHD/YefM family antitoxin component YafN of YafNO toxin-antitoxin module